MKDAFLGKLLSWHWKSVALTAFAGLSMASGIAAAQSQNPVDAIKDAWKKAKQQQKAGQPPQPAGAPQPGNPPPAGSPAPQPGNAPPTAVAAARPSTSSGVASAGGATIEEMVVAPVQQGAIYSISSHGVHVGMISTSGSRAVVLYDNIPGPKFDAVFNNGSTGGIQFSPDGTRYAYCARAGNEWVVMVDGQEVARGPIIANNPNPEITFTSNRKHFYFLGTTDHGMSGFYFDGKLIVQDGSPTPVISPDGDHYAYTVHATKGAGELLKFIIDGKPAGYLGDHPQWSADSKHLFTTAPGTTDILLDGKPFLRAQRATLTIPPVGSMVVATLIRSGTGPQVSFLVIGGKKIDGSEAEAIIHVTISPDGKHYAALCSGNGKFWVFSDGKRGLSYDNITPDDAVKFTADSSKVVYTPTANGKHFLVMGDQESEGFDYPPKVVIAPAGSHAGVLYDGGPSSSVIIDAKTFSAGVGLNAATDLGFSPDGSHFAYVAGQRLILDGVPQPASIILPISVPHTYLPFVFSPDGKHVAHGAVNPVQTGRPDQGVFLDGKFLSMAPLIAGRGLYQMTFTPDSKHLLWLMDGKPNGQLSAVRLYLDGQFVAEEYYRGGNWFNTGGWDMQPDGSLLMLVQDNASLKRIRITPSPGASIETFLATGFAPRR